MPKVAAERNLGSYEAARNVRLGPTASITQKFRLKSRLCTHLGNSHLID